MELNADGTRARIDVTGTFSATELESVIRRLAALRSRMTPPVPHPFPKAGDPIPEDLRLLTESDPSFNMGRHPDGRFTMTLRSAGFGWLVYLIPVSSARSVLAYLRSVLPDDQDGADHVGQDRSQGHLPH